MRCFRPTCPSPGTGSSVTRPGSCPKGAEVTRVGPSPTGSMHIGTIYSAMIDRDIAHQSGGRYLLRIEDTDQSREVEGALDQFARAFDYFGLPPDEEEGRGDYGPYHQSRRAPIYMTYARELLRQNKAYLCFATPAELAEIRNRQQAAKLPPGYYGEWAIWRDAPDEEVRRKLAEGAPYVVRFRSPGVPGRRIEYTEAIRGRLSTEDNFNDVVILKSGGQRPGPAAHLPFRARGRRSPDAGQPGDQGRGMAALRADAPAAVRRAGLRAAGLRAHLAADEADPRRQAQAVQAQGPGDQRRLLYRGRLPGQGGAVLPARAGQRLARRAAARRGARPRRSGWPSWAARAR